MTQDQIKRIVTGIKPTGDIHLGNYFGMIKPLVDLQRQGYECFAFLADYHALNQVNNPAQLRKDTQMITLAYLAAGFDTDKGKLYRQSSMPEVAALTTILNTVAPMGLLDRAHAVKDARAKGNEEILHMGTYDYPVLMTADVVLYGGTHVPVGADQVQHLEIARDIVQKYNRIYSGKLTEPQHIVQESNGTIPGIDGRKMSKSYGNTVGLFDGAEVIREKIAKVPTDTKSLQEPKSSDDIIAQLLSLVAPEHPLLAAYCAGGIGYKQMKDAVAEAITEHNAPFRVMLQQYAAGEIDPNRVLQDGAEHVRPIARQTLAEVYQQTGLV
jgi:tryptophanyl-tRNA synthetase